MIAIILIGLLGLFVPALIGAVGEMLAPDRAAQQRRRMI